MNSKTLKGVPAASLPWARSVDERLGKTERFLSNLGYDVKQLPDLDKTVFSEHDSGQNIAYLTNGKVDPGAPVNVRFVSSTGLFEVTVSLAGLVRAGGLIAAGFESVENPFSVEFDIPKYSVVHAAPEAQTSWTPFASSYTTVISTRPGLQDLSMFYYGRCIFSASSAGYVERARLSVKAV